MKINTFQRRSYSSETANKYLNANKEFILASATIEETFEYDGNNNRNVTGKRVWVLQESLNPFYVKLPASIEIDAKQFDKVSFENLEAIEIKNNVYFRASTIIKQK
ncbi:hypothetical protein P7H59_07415 [Enterococcus viikkiensis]|uniref:Uncharacterized protein n=1 Tax=Enterococcus viikkiensis TaxID=930854 RepID=A0ABU3FQM2_9ENTE|nr:hypothetical protein [Enterococcus viikkiensis]MDT2828288.1 hypothetical protein [Enterococcus viikkiensis]